MKNIRDILHRFRPRLGQRTILIIASVVVGVVSALAAVMLKTFVHWMHLIPDYFFREYGSRYLYIVLPLTGILLTVLVVRIFFKGKIEKGLGNILFSIIRGSAKMERRQTYSHIVTSGITVGFGGSAGLEAPIVITGSAIGSNIATRFGFGYKERALLLACGAAAGIAAVFNSPIAGVIFAIEVLLTDITIPLFIPLLISTATAIIISKILYSGQLFYLITDQWYAHAIPFHILLGVICGLISVYMNRVNLFIEGFLDERNKPFPKALIGGTLLGLLIFLFPPLWGEGYPTITSLLNGSVHDIIQNSFFSSAIHDPWLFLVFLLLIIVVKVVATALTIGSGGNGGIFAPSLFTGALTGFSLAFAINLMGGDLNLNNFIALGMAGIMSGVIHAPLTAIFLIAEITGGYVLIVPLMIVSAISFFISRYFEPYSVYTKKLSKQGFDFSGNKDIHVLKQINLNELIETEFVILLNTDKLGKLIPAFTNSNRNVFPVVDATNNFIGIIQLDEVKEYFFKPELFEQISIEELTRKDILTISFSEDMDSVMTKIENSNLWNIPVTRDGKYVGFISRSNILSYYRRILKMSKPMF